MRLRTLSAVALLTVTAAALPASGSDPAGPLSVAGPEPSLGAGTDLSTSSPPVTSPAPIHSPVEPMPTKLTDIDRQLEELTRAERAIRQKMNELAEEAKAADARVLVRGRAYTRMARAGLMPIGAGLDALVDHAAKLERLRRAVARDLELIQTLSEKRLALGNGIEKIHAARRPLEVQHQAVSKARTALLAQQDRALAFERAFSSSAGVAHTAIYGSGLGPSDPTTLASGFAAMKGRLPFPIAGRAEIRSANRLDGPGLEMFAPFGAPVRAVYAGRVAFADSYAEYGKTVIVDHGGSHYTVSAGLSEVTARAGDEVTVGTRLGSVGDTGKGAMLYFEIRVGTDSVDPAEWFGI